MNKEVLSSIVEKFLEKPYLIGMGAGSLSKIFGCAREDIYKVRNIIKSKQIEEDERENINLPKILVLDIETAPLRGFAWSRWKQNINLNQTISDWYILTWSAKWLYESKMRSAQLTPEEVVKEDDKRIMLKMWDLLNEADIIIAHNGDSFDMPRLNAAFLKHNIIPPSPYKQIDTKKIAAKQFGFSSNKLDALAIMFNIPVKLGTDMSLWTRCMSGEQKALTEMGIYNDHDVEILEEVYLILRPWIKSHPNAGLYMQTEDPVCPYCGNKDVSLIENHYSYTNTSKFELYRCNSCSGISRKRKSIVSKIKRKELLVPIPK